MRAANTNIGAARAAFFPTVSLTGTYGFSSTELEGLFSGNPARAWTFAPSVSVPIFSGGRLSAELDVAKLRRETEKGAETRGGGEVKGRAAVPRERTPRRIPAAA